MTDPNPKFISLTWRVEADPQTGPNTLKFCRRVNSNEAQALHRATAREVRACSRQPLAELSTSRQLHLEGRTLTQGRLDPDAPTVHLHDLLGDGESEAGAALGLGKGAVDLMELLEDARPLALGNAGPRIGHADVEVTIDRLGSHAHLARVRELDGVAH